MKAKRLSKKLHALIVVAAMIVAQLAAVLPTSAASNVLPVAQYVTQVGSSTGGAGGNSSTYNGTVKLKIPMSKVLDLMRQRWQMLLQMVCTHTEERGKIE